MYTNANLAGEDTVLALQTIDTLKTIAGDKDLIKRFKSQNMVPYLASMIKESILTI